MGKKGGERLAFSADYKFQAGAGTRRQVIRFNFRRLRFVESVVFENISTWRLIGLGFSLCVEDLGFFSPANWPIPGLIGCGPKHMRLPPDQVFL
jgi:hypothetical protein